MTNPKFVSKVAAVALGALLSLGSVAEAAKGDCAQPLNDNPTPLASDCLFILQAAVDLQTCDPTCICDVTGDGTILAGDALQCLQFSVGTPGITLDCDCPPPNGTPGCSSAEFFALPGSDLDTGWTGVGHNADIIEGAAITFQVLRRCDVQGRGIGDGDPCEDDSDCEGEVLCQPTCDCIDDTICEAKGPTHQTRCLTTLTACETNADCPFSCEQVFGPPLPLSTGGTGACIVTLFTDPITGTVDSSTGEANVSIKLRSRVFLGETAKPCPRCGKQGDPGFELGAQFTCDGGQRNGQACTVEAISPDFGGVSTQCAPNLGDNVSGIGLAVRFSEVTTQETTKQALLPCTGFGFTEHPANGTGVCTDTFEDCDTNSDCKRCSEDGTTACDDDGDCSGSCLEGPDSAVTCGYYCHCGFCTTGGVQDPDAPCFSDNECTGGATCEVGKGTSTQPTAPQVQPNNCNSTLCGLNAAEECHSTFQGFCSEETFRPCIPGGQDVCGAQGAGFCDVEFRPCFGGEITRVGAPSPLGSYCSGGDNSDPCTSNADCLDPARGPAVSGDPICTPDASRPTSVALFCVGATASPAINSAGGTTGPGSISFKSFIKTCRCGDGDVGCDEECDDGNQEAGDGCDRFCRDE